MAFPDGVGAVPDRAGDDAAGRGGSAGDSVELATHRLTIAYLGLGFGGWQRQTNALSVQEVVETAIERVVGEPVRLHGASRTDAGVHALGQESHLRLSRSWPSRALVEGTNHHLPPEVRVLRAQPAAPGFHARGWAMAKEYHYRMSRRAVLSPFEAPTTVRVPADLELDRFRRGLELLEGRHDFRAFARSGGSHRQTWRRVFVADLAERGFDLTFRIVGDGFLRGMVRAVVGTLLQVATGRLTLERWAALLDGAERAAAGPSAPAHGLILMRVVYPDEPDPLATSGVAVSPMGGVVAPAGAVDRETL